MRKTKFIKFYNKITLLGVINLLIYGAIFGIKWLGNEMDISAINPIMDQNIHELLNKIVYYLQSSFKFLLVITLILIIYLVIDKILNDSFLNLARSIRETYRIRKFMRQKPKLEGLNTENSVKSENAVISEYNRFVRHCILDISQFEIVLYIKMPKSNQAQKILREMQDDIKEHVSSLNTNFVISPFERKGYSLWLKGTKKK